ncbi:MAG: glucuronate isomerase [Pirellulales bacterium]|nr:glucuronate isomerase [Pirellulales bacterium]
MNARFMLAVCTDLHRLDSDSIAMSQELRQRIFAELDAISLIDPHTHINPHAPVARDLGDILGYHYYTELAHSAGLARVQIEEHALPPKAKVARLAEVLPRLDNTVQYSWLIEIAQRLFGFTDDCVNADNWEVLWNLAAAKMGSDDWEQTVLQESKLDAVFLTNDFDDSLSGFDTGRYIPCLRTDDLVFHLATLRVRERLESATGITSGSAGSLRSALGKLFEHFVNHNAKACAISLPPGFSPRKVSDAEVSQAFSALAKAGQTLEIDHRSTLACFAFWTLAEFCQDYRLPFDLMIGVNRSVYSGGVYQGQDLFDSRVSLIQYRELFNSFPQVTFPVSVLASVTNQELVAYSWIFPNVIANGHWWYSNTPAYIEADAAARLEAIPKTKQIGYYSDMYKLEFALPKFAMYKRVLSKILSDRFVQERNWPEERAVSLGKQVLRGNVERYFGFAT